MVAGDRPKMAKLRVQLYFATGDKLLPLQGTLASVFLSPILPNLSPSTATATATSGGHLSILTTNTAATGYSSTDGQTMRTSSSRNEEQVVHFKKGSVVEVRSWNNVYQMDVATILELPKQNQNRFWIEYHDLLGVLPGEKLKSYVLSNLIRPLPPPASDDDSSLFELNAVVDAYFAFSWWTGVISKVHESNSELFTVLFQDPKEEVPFDRSNLRLHQDWVDGKWILPPKKVVTKQQSQTSSLVAETSQIPASSYSQDYNGDTTAEYTGTDHVSKEIEIDVLSDDSTDDDQPISKSESQEETARHSLGFDAVGDNMPIENQNLPFVKSCSAVWKSIESMEVFKKMPQNPHFHSLGKCIEVLREGLAIGSMVSFANLVERTLKLQFNEPRSTIVSSLEALADLEMHGFDVKVVQGRLKKLLLIKEKQENLQSRSEEIQRQIVEHTWKKTKYEEEIGQIQKEMMDLQEKLAMAKSTEESEESEIALLKLSVHDLNERMRCLQHDFESELLPLGDC